jgi:2Fe-2S ferredoxin
MLSLEFVIVVLKFSGNLPSFPLINKYNSTLHERARRPSTINQEGIVLINITVKDLDGQVHEVQGRDGGSLMEVLNDHEWGTPAVCGGLCSCGTCHVYIEGDWLGKLRPVDSDEQELLDIFVNTKENSRLSCQLYLQKDHDGLTLSIAPEE